MEDLALYTFTIGLTPRIANIVRCRDPKNLNDAINCALSEEKLQQYSYKQNMLAKTSRNNDANTRPNRTGNFNNNQNQKPSSSQPTSKDPFCRYCKKAGHLLENCRLRDYNNKKFNNKPSNSNVQPSTSFKPQINTFTEAEGYDTVDGDLN
ncbi:hypothetical protein PYW07_008160 [Mythimna separata]|uniref:CCHC-type domain-containing protein n=1 Tax=Mythimna separata TaxID=271217 RepID=A0AAD7YPQ9_MYTSE|nr:hypothetical protein PYW07_008160 [Mythimna separata]